MAILSMIPQADLDLTAYLNELLRTNKAEQQNNTFWIPTLEDPGEPEDHTPLQTRILKELIELNEMEKPNPQESPESRKTYLSKDLIGLTRLKQKQKNNQLKTFWSTIMTFWPDTEWIYGLTRSSS